MAHGRKLMLIKAKAADRMGGMARSMLDRAERLSTRVSKTGH